MKISISASLRLTRKGTDSMRNTGKREFILVAAILVAATFLYLINRISHQEPAAVVDISVDGEVVETLDLSIDQELTIQGAGDGTNHLVVQDGQVWVTEASCPDHLCIRQGKISMDGQVIVCLPNRMTAAIRGQ